MRCFFCMIENGLSYDTKKHSVQMMHRLHIRNPIENKEEKVTLLRKERFPMVKII